jgi:hypothetical protein
LQQSARTKKKRQGNHSTHRSRLGPMVSSLPFWSLCPVLYNFQGSTR